MPNLALDNSFIKITLLLFAVALFLCVRGIALASTLADIKAGVNLCQVVFILLAIGAIYTGAYTGTHNQTETNLFLALIQFLTLFISTTANLLDNLSIIE